MAANPGSSDNKKDGNDTQVGTGTTGKGNNNSKKPSSTPSGSGGNTKNNGGKGTSPRAGGSTSKSGAERPEADRPGSAKKGGQDVKAKDSSSAPVQKPERPQPQDSAPGRPVTGSSPPLQEHPQGRPNAPGPVPGGPGGPGGMSPAGTASPQRPMTGGPGGSPGGGPGGPGPAPSRPVGGVQVKPRPQTKTAAGAPRKAHLVLNRFEPWSVMKFSFVMSLVAFVVLFVAVMVLYWVLSLLGVFDALGQSITNITSTGGEGETGTDIMEWFSAATILGYTALLGAINVVLITAAATIGSVIYNNVAALVGGVEVTFSESE